MLELKKDGLLILKDFLSETTLNNLKSESDELFLDENFLRGSRRSVFLSRRPNFFYKAVQDPLYSFRSVNLLELSLKILRFIKKSKVSDNEKWILTNIDCFREKNKDPLFWHTDRRKGMIRAILYLSDADNKSGSFRYMQGTHERDYYVKHQLDQNKAIELSDKIFECNGDAGDLILFDPMGFHGNNPRINTRTNLVFEFQLQSVNSYPRSNLTLLSSNLTDKVLENIDVFCCSPEGVHGQSSIWLTRNPEFAPTNILIRSTFMSIIKDISQLLSSIPWLRSLFSRIKSNIK